MSHFCRKNRENYYHKYNINLTGIYIAIWAILVRGVILTWSRDFAIWAIEWTCHSIKENWQVKILSAGDIEGNHC